MRRTWTRTRNLPCNPRPRSQARLRLEQLEARDLPSVFTPAQIRIAYGFNQLTNSGAGQTIAIVDAYHSPTLANDLAVFNSQWQLAPVNLKVVDQSGGTVDTSGNWGIETALDVEWAHAIAPAANILLVEAKSDTLDSTGAPVDLLTAVDSAANAATAAGLGIAPATVVSMSWGLNEWAGETALDSHFSVAGVTFVAASGDSGRPPIWPAVSPNVLGVGGTSLKLLSSGAYSSEKGWGYGSLSWLFGGSGGGISQFESKPSYQSTVTQSATKRTSPDVAYDADPNTGFYVYDSYNNGGWYSVGGTSAGSPQWAGLLALANQSRATAGLGSLSSTQTLAALYALPSNDFHDVTSGNNGYAATVGYDLVTGRGSPKADLVVPGLAGTTAKAAASTPATTSTSSGKKGNGHTPPVVVVTVTFDPSLVQATLAASRVTSFTATLPTTGAINASPAPVVSALPLPVLTSQSAIARLNGAGDGASLGGVSAKVDSSAGPAVEEVPAAAAPALRILVPRTGAQVGNAVDAFFTGARPESMLFAEPAAPLQIVAPESQASPEAAAAIAGLLMALVTSRGRPSASATRTRRWFDV